VFAYSTLGKPTLGILDTRKTDTRKIDTRNLETDISEHSFPKTLTFKHQGLKHQHSGLENRTFDIMAPGHRKLLSFLELPGAGGGVFLLNPGKQEAHHQLNKDFRQYVRQHPMFLLQYVIAFNNQSRESMLLLREA